MSSGRPLGSDSRDGLQAVAILCVVLGGGASFLVLGTLTSQRDFAIIAAVLVAALGTIASGKPRICCLWGLMLTIPLNLSKRFGPMFLGKAGGEDSFRVEISDLFLVALILFIVWDLFAGRRKGIRIPKLTVPWVLLMVIGVIWVIVGPWRTSAAHETVRMFKVLILFVVIANTVNTPRLVWHCCAALALGAITEAVIGLAQYSIKGLIGLAVLGETSEGTILVLAETSVQGAAVFRPSALLQHANLMGMYLAVMLPIAIAMLLTSRKAVFQMVFLTAIALASPGVVISLSRSAWLSAFVAVVLVFCLMLLHPKLRWRSLRAGAMVGLVGVIVLASLSGPILQRALNSKNDSAVAREIYKADARKMIADAPWLGHGLNGYTFELPSYTNISMRTYGEKLPSVHHIFYLWWAETGLIGMLLFCSVWGSIIWTGVTNLGVKNEVLFAVNAACLAAMICLIPDAFFSFTLRTNQMLRIFWMFGGLIFAIRYIRVREGRRLRYRPPDRSVMPARTALVPVPHG